MAYLICNTYRLPPYTGATLRAQLYDSDNVAVGGAISTGFYERPGGFGIFNHVLIVPDGHQGWCDVYVDGAPGVIIANVAINPQELENPDVKTSDVIDAIEAISCGDGTIEFTYTLTSSQTGLPIPGAAIRITSDLAGLITLWTGTTDVLGIARNLCNDKPRLLPGNIFIFRSHPSFTFSDPDQESVS